MIPLYVYIIAGLVGAIIGLVIYHKLLEGGVTIIIKERANDNPK